MHGGAKFSQRLSPQQLSPQQLWNPGHCPGSQPGPWYRAAGRRSLHLPGPWGPCVQTAEATVNQSPSEGLAVGLLELGVGWEFGKGTPKYLWECPPVCPCLNPKPGVTCDSPPSCPHLDCHSLLFTSCHPQAPSSPGYCHFSPGQRHQPPDWSPSRSWPSIHSKAAARSVL